MYTSRFNTKAAFDRHHERMERIKVLLDLLDEPQTEGPISYVAEALRLVFEEIE